MVPKRGLGRGLGALLASTPAESEALVEVALDDIHPNPHQPRKLFEADGLEELAASIRASGVLQPVIARRTAAGLRADRRRAALAGRASGRTWTASPSSSERRPTRRAWSSPWSRISCGRTSTPSRKPRPTSSCSRSSTGPRRTCRRRSARTEALLPIVSGSYGSPIAIQDDLKAGRLTMGHARALLALTLPSEQLKLRDEILAHSWSVRTTEEGVNRRRAVRSSAPPPLRGTGGARGGTPAVADDAGEDRRQRPAREDRGHVRDT